MIVHFVSNLTASAGGVPKSSLALAGALADLGEETELWTTDFSFVPSLEPGRAPGRGAAGPLVVRTFPLDRPRGLMRSSELGRALSEERGRIRGLHVHGTWFPAGSGLMARARQSGIPYVLRPAGMLAARAFELHRSKKRLYWGLFERQNVRGAAALHFSTAAEKSASPEASRLAADVLVAPNGLDEQFLLEAARPGPARPGHRAKRPVRIGALGRLDPMKRLDRLVGAAERLRRDGLAVEVLLAGADTEGFGPELRRLVAGTGLGASVRLLGHLDLSAKLEFLRSLDVLVCCSEFESFGIALLEGVAAGVPSIVTPGVVLAPQLEAEGAAVVVEPTEEAIASGIRRILADESLVGSLAVAGPRFARPYRWEAIAREVRAAYDRLFPRSGTAKRA